MMQIIEMDKLTRKQKNLKIVQGKLRCIWKKWKVKGVLRIFEWI